MPSQTSSPGQSPNETSFIEVPEFTRISNERQQSGGRGLNQMNEISASILGRLSQEAPTTDMDSDQINANTSPVQVPNLSSPNSYQFLDLSLNMNLNSGTPISLQENPQESGAGSDVGTFDSQAGFSSENSDLEDEYLETGSHQHDNDDDSGDENSADDDDSDSNEAGSSELIFNDDYDFYRRVQQSNRDGIPMDNGSNYYNSFISYTREHGYGSFSRMSLESIRSSFPSSIPAPHRLLLSSARQNTTNQNTLVNMRSPPRDFESNRGFSLRRQNAIRVKPWRMSSQKVAIMANALYKDFKGAFAAIRTEDPFAGKFPIFENHSCCIQPSTCDQTTDNQDRRFSLKYKMRAFLQFRNDTRLWNAHADSFRASRENKEKPSALKRKHAGPDVSATKKQRLMRSSGGESTSNEYVDLKLGERINVAELSSSERLNILDGLPCSFMKDGSAFAMKVVNSWAANSEADHVNVSFSQVNLKDKFLHGCFDVRKNLELSGDIYDITSFLGFLCGGSRSRYTINVANSVIQSKFSLLNDLFMTMIVDLGITNPKITQALYGTMQIPFSGEIIDFKKHDLRFLRERKSKTYPRIRGISSRIENERARLQINEWLNVKPFSDFSETFFMNYLYFTEQKLKRISSAASSEQLADLEFAGCMKDSIFYLSRNFQSVQNAKIPMIERKSRQTNKELRQRRRHEPRSNLRKSTFMKDWESKVCEKLCDHITCGDTCLLNLQLNFMLFTVRVDISAEIDKVFSRFLGLVLRDSERTSLEKKYKSLCKQTLSSEAKDALFLCSLNRKTGSLEMHNTRSYLDFKYFNSTQPVDLPLGSTRDPSSANAIDGYFGDSLFSARACSYSEDPSLMATPSILRGESRRGAAGSFSHGGGSAQFDFI